MKIKERLYVEHFEMKNNTRGSEFDSLDATRSFITCLSYRKRNFNIKIKDKMKRKIDFFFQSLDSEKRI